MAEDPDSSSFLARAYKIAKLIAITTSSIVAFIISLIALDVSKGHWWVDNKLPLYAVVIAITVVVEFVRGFRSGWRWSSEAHWIPGHFTETKLRA